VLNDVGDVHVIAHQSGPLQTLIENPAGWPDEWMPFAILAVPGLLSDQHHAGTARTLAHHALGGAFP
jgi:hypothetical protein